MPIKIPWTNINLCLLYKLICLLDSFCFYFKVGGSTMKNVGWPHLLSLDLLQTSYYQRLKDISWAACFNRTGPKLLQRTKWDLKYKYFEINPMTIGT